ncbi:MAG: RNA polymerase sigma-70 factor [Tannerella sp.]|jgi:RNA polymerase sigma-70 factor (ECF subfamily)|nr:RNA polymerase sigma-70 factor [Tannerella sp.]
MKVSSTSDHQLNGNFDAVYVTYYPRMVRFARDYVLLEEDAENIVQDIFVMLWEKRDVLDIKVSLVPYLFTLVKNRCLDFLRHKTAEEAFAKEYEAKQMALEQLNYAFSSDEDIEEILNAALNSLPERCREIFIKSRVEGKKYREIAGELNISVNTVETQMSVALRKLQISLKDYLPLLLFLLDVK